MGAILSSPGDEEEPGGKENNSHLKSGRNCGGRGRKGWEQERALQTERMPKDSWRLYERNLLSKCLDAFVLPPDNLSIFTSQITNKIPRGIT